MCLFLYKYDKIIRGGLRTKTMRCQYNYNNNRGQALIEYMLLVALVVGMISFMIGAFGPKQKEMAEALRTSMQKIVSNGSLEYGHPLNEGRVKEVE